MEDIIDNKKMKIYLNAELYKNFYVFFIYTISIVPLM